MLRPTDRSSYLCRSIDGRAVAPAPRTVIRAGGGQAGDLARHLDRLLKLRQLRIVSALADQGSISRASPALGLSQPALTKALQQLERTVEAQIFEREARGVRPTAVGHAVIDAARRILAELRRLDEELDRIASGTSNSVAVGATPSPVIGLMPKVLADLHSRSAKLQVRLVEGAFEDLAPALSVGEIDLIVGRLYEPPVPDGLTREELYDDPIVMLVRADHPLSRGNPSMADVSLYDLIVPPVSRRYGQEIDQLLALHTDLHPPLMRASSFGFARAMLYATDMVALAPKLMMSPDIERGHVRIVPLNLLSPRRPSGITYRSDHPLSSGAHAFVDGLRAVIQKMNP